MAEGWSSWTPILKVADAERSTAFYCDTLGFVKDWEHRFEQGWPLYVAVSRGSMTLHLSEHQGGGTEKASLFVDVDDIDAVYSELVERGLVAEEPPTDQEYGLRDFSFTDPDGHHITFGTRIGP
jgi:uncharacterized glyoxalase superfamily protein PhnB